MNSQVKQEITYKLHTKKVNKERTCRVMISDLTYPEMPGADSLRQAKMTEYSAEKMKTMKARSKALSSKFSIQIFSDSHETIIKLKIAIARLNVTL
jgi:hypothetical protein